jgi:hypothetical protein
VWSNNSSHPLTHQEEATPQKNIYHFLLSDYTKYNLPFNNLEDYCSIKYSQYPYSKSLKLRTFLNDRKYYQITARAFSATFKN